MRDLFDVRGASWIEYVLITLLVSVVTVAILATTFGR